MVSQWKRRSKTLSFHGWIAPGQVVSITVDGGRIWMEGTADASGHVEVNNIPVPPGHALEPLVQLERGRRVSRER